MLIVGLAPAARSQPDGPDVHGRPERGRAVPRPLRGGLASQPTATSTDDGMELFGVRMVAPVHCAPPQNKPTTTERDNCAKWFRRADY